MERRGRDQVVDDGNTVERDAVLNLTRTGADEVLAGRRSVGGFEALKDPGGRNRELERIASVQRQLGDCLPGDDLSQARLIGGDGWVGRRYFDGLGDLSDL